MEQHTKLRIKFKKYGAVRFIGHLDVMRFFQKAIRRAGIDVAYTGGFSPHQVMTFAAPLGVGLTSNGEYMDIEVNSFVSCQDVRERLNAASVPGIEIVSVGVLPATAGNAMASVAAAEYTVSFREGKEPKTDLEKAIPLFLAKETIPYVKETKKGTRELNLRQGIFRLSFETGRNMTGASQYDDTNQTKAQTVSGTCGKVCLNMLLDASSGGNIKPAQVIEALLAEKGESLQENALLITREDVYTCVGIGEDIQLVSLDKLALQAYPESRTDEVCR